MTNTSIKTAKFLKYALWGCLYLILLVPLLLSSKFLFPFITLKAIYFRLAVEIALLLYILLALADSYYRPKMNKLAWAVVGFGLIVMLTTIFSVNPYKSFWGNIERGEGALTISHLIIFFFILSQTIRTKKEMFNYLTASVFVNLLVSIYALSQRFGAEWTIKPGETRLSATLGNAAYMGAYVMGHIWICLALISSAKNKIWKIIFSAVILLNLYILYETETRGAILALAVSGFFFLLFSVLFSGSKRTRAISAVLIIFLMFTATFIRSGRDSEWILKYNTLNRLASISFDDITTQSRFYAWDSSWKGWQDRFLIGYGWENYNVAFDRYYHPEIFRDQGSQIWFDRAHNTVFDVAVATGIIGLLVYLSMFIIAFITLFQYTKLNPKQNLYFSFSMMSFLLAHFIQNIFVFDCLATYIMMFTVFGAIAFIGNESRLSAEHKIKPLNIYALAVGIIAISAAVYNFNLRPVKANQMGIAALQTMYQGNINQSIKLFDQAIDMNTYQSPELRQKFAENMLYHNNQSRGLTDKEVEENYKKAIERIKQNIDKYPTETQNYLYLMALYNANYKYDSNYLNQVIYYGEKAKILSPTRQQIYFEMGRAKVVMGRVDDGIADFKHAIELNPKTRESHWNLLTAYILTGRFADAKEHYQKYLAPGQSVKDLEKLARLYGSTTNNQELIEIYQKLIEFEPDNVSHWTSLAAVYKKEGETDKARATTLRVMETSDDPQVLAEAKKFLEELE